MQAKQRGAVADAEVGVSSENALNDVVQRAGEPPASKRSDKDCHTGDGSSACRSMAAGFGVSTNERMPVARIVTSPALCRSIWAMTMRRRAGGPAMCSDSKVVKLVPVETDRA